MTIVSLMLAALASCACGGGSPSGPSAVVAAAPSAPTYTYTVERWAVGLPMHHCFGAGIDVQVAQWAANEMSAASGIPQTLDGPCNVEWVMSAIDTANVEGTCAKTQSGLATTHAVLTFENGRALFHAAVHEGGHALGLVHSTDRNDVMFAPGSSNVNTFSPHELALLRTIYDR